MLGLGSTLYLIILSWDPMMIEQAAQAKVVLIRAAVDVTRIPTTVLRLPFKWLRAQTPP